MAKHPGLAVYHGESVTVESDGSVSAGDAVTRTADGQVTQLTDTNGSFYGVVADTVEDHDAGDMISVQRDGIIVTNVAAGTTDGTELGGSVTAGELASGTGAGKTYSDEGGTYRGASLDAGYAAVDIG